MLTKPRLDVSLLEEKSISLVDLARIFSRHCQYSSADLAAPRHPARDQYDTDRRMRLLLYQMAEEIAQAANVDARTFRKGCILPANYGPPREEPAPWDEEPSGDDLY